MRTEYRYLHASITASTPASTHLHAFTTNLIELRVGNDEDINRAIAESMGSVGTGRMGMKAADAVTLINDGPLPVGGGSVADVDDADLQAAIRLSLGLPASEEKNVFAMSFFEFITSPIGEKNRIPNFNL